MPKRNYYVAVFLTTLSVLVNHFQNVSSATIATVTDENALLQTNGNATTSSSLVVLPETVTRIEFNYSTDSFKEIEPGVLQFIGEDLWDVTLSCHLTSNKEAFLSWKYHGIEERKVKRQKHLDDENGLVIDLSKGPPVVRMECYYPKNRTISNSILIYTGANKSPYLYKNGETIRATALNQSIAYISCLLMHPLGNDGKELQLFKDGELVTNDRLSYIPELGYYLNLTQLENPLGKYECRVKNSTKDDVVSVDLDYDAYVRVSYKGYRNNFYAGAPQLHPFECRLPKDVFGNKFQWFYLWKNGAYTALNETDVKQTDTEPLYYTQNVKVTFPSNSITDVVCAGTVNGTSYNSSYQVEVKKSYPPMILNQPLKEPIVYTQGMNITCFTTSEPRDWTWLKNGQPLNNGETIKENLVYLPFKSSLFLKPLADDKIDNYTCIVSNFLGNVSHDFRIQTKQPSPPKSFDVQYLVIAAVILAVAVVLLGIFLTFFKLNVVRRRLDPNLMDWFFRGRKAQGIPYNELEPYASVSYDFSYEIKPDKLNFVRELRGGNFGQVHFGWLHDSNADTTIPVAIKQIKDVPTASEQDVKYEFMSFLNEIKIMQYIGCHKHVVGYVGAVTSDIAKYSAYLVVEYCSEGDLASYLQKFANNGGLFHDDIQGLHSVSQTHSGQVVLKTSHLMKWAEDIADGMHYISSKGLVHRDLAARNVLLGYQGINSDEYENVDPGKLIAKISDFGLSKALYELDSDYYKIVFDPVEENNRPRRLPLRWLSIEALKSLKFTTKSDVWALGVTYWEMFTLVREVPYFSEVPDSVDLRMSLIHYIDTGSSLSEPEYAPQEMWEVMLQCWQENPADRPGFHMIRDTLKAVNEKISYIQDSNGGSNNTQVTQYEAVQVAPVAAPNYSTIGIMEELGYNNTAYIDQQSGASGTESEDGEDSDADETIIAQQNYPNSPYQNSNVLSYTSTPYATVGYVENLGYDNMEMDQYYGRKTVTEGDDGKEIISNNESDKPVSLRVTVNDQISASG